MIIDVIKYLFVGAKDDIDVFFARAQKKGIIEFIPGEGKKPLEVPPTIQSFRLAIHILKKASVVSQVFPQGGLEYAKEVANRVIELRQNVEKLEEEVRSIEAEIFRIDILGDFSLEDIQYIEREGKKKIQFFCMKTSAAHTTDFADSIFYIGTKYDLDYFFAVEDEPKSYPGMIELHIDRSLSELKNRLLEAQKEIHEDEQRISELARYIAFLEHSLLEELNVHNLMSAKGFVDFPLGEGLFVVEAWIPKNKEPALFALLDKLSVHAEPIAVEPEDKIPTYMENKGINQLGEDLVHIYDTPARSDKDPSGWVIWFFMLFFAMIVGDGGYGLIYLGLALFLKWKFPRMKRAGRKFLKMVFVLSTACVVWGFLSCSFFGLYIQPGSFLSEISFVRYLSAKKAEYHFQAKDEVYQEWMHSYPQLKNVETPKEFLNAKLEGKHPVLETFNDNVLMELALLVGSIHICSSFLRYFRRNFAGLGWVAFVIGGYLFFPSILGATSMVNYLGLVSKPVAYEFGKQLVYGGIAGSALLGLLQNGLKGISELLNVVSVFGDILSYLRIYALALAGAIMAQTFNDLGHTLGLAIGLFVVLMGHGVNILLSIMGGTIHGLRLNFLEWYRYSFEGGGKLFVPLKRFKSD